MTQNNLSFYSKIVNAQFRDRSRVDLIIQKLEKMEKLKSSQAAIEYIAELFGQKHNQNTLCIEGINIEIKNNDKLFSVKVDYDNKIKYFIFKKLIKKENEAKNN
ncbi:MAG: hypothetical protein MJ231_04015 [bacterium]|nr:hypothetical protein [bacterium]